MTFVRKEGLYFLLARSQISALVYFYFWINMYNSRFIVKFHQKILEFVFLEQVEAG